MATNTTKLDLRKPGENDFYNQQTEQAENWDKVDKFADDIQKNVDFNLLATLGIEYGGILNNTDAKVAGKAYYDTTGKKLYKCTANTSINYADAGYFEALSNNDLLGKLQNLTQFNKAIIQTGEYYDVEYSENKLFNMMLIKIIPKNTIPGGFEAIVSGLPNNYKQTEFVVTGNFNTTRPFRYSNGSVISFGSQEVLNPSFYGSCILFKKD